jgi:hypothetical protein
MVARIDIWRAAALLLERCGVDARGHVRQHVVDMSVRQDEAGEAAWRAILVAIEELQRSERRDDEGLQ